MHPGFNLHVHVHDSELAQLIPVATLEFIASTEAGRVMDEEMIGNAGIGTIWHNHWWIREIFASLFSSFVFDVFF